MTPELLFNAMILAMVGDDLHNECIANSIDSTPEAFDFCTPYELGKLDGEDGKPCESTEYGFIKVTDHEMYIVGYREGREAAHIEDSEEYRDYQADVEFWRQGC